MLLRYLVPLYIVFAAGCAPYLVVSGGVVNWEKLAEVKVGLARLRGLEFKSDVPVDIRSRQEMGRYLEKELEREYGDEKLGNLSLAYAKLGLVPQGFDLKKSVTDFLNSQVAAFYDPRTKRLVLPPDLEAGLFAGAVQFLARRDIVGEMVLAHELSHALQDQHFSLGDRVRPSTNDDRTLAFRAMVEGDATISGFAYVLGGVDEEFLAQVQKEVRQSTEAARSEFSGMPDAILEQLLFQYYGGVSFVARWLDQRGWLGVDRLYSSPPLSTEQVLHPEKYVTEADPPTLLELGDLSSLFSPPWKEIENNVLGELMVRVLFKQFFSVEEAARLAGGWDGDRLVAFRRGDEVAFIWATLWDSEKDAEEFLQGYREILERKRALAQAYLERRGRLVLVVEGLEKSQVEAAIEKIWQRIELKEEPFKPPFPPVKRARPGAGGDLAR